MISEALQTVCRCIVADGVYMVCADDSLPAVKVAVFTNKSTTFHSVRLPVSTSSYLTPLSLLSPPM